MEVIGFTLPSDSSRLVLYINDWRILYSERSTRRPRYHSDRCPITWFEHVPAPPHERTLVNLMVIQLHGGWWSRSPCKDRRFTQQLITGCSLILPVDCAVDKFISALERVFSNHVVHCRPDVVWLKPSPSSAHARQPLRRRMYRDDVITLTGGLSTVSFRCRQWKLRDVALMQRQWSTSNDDQQRGTSGRRSHSESRTVTPPSHTETTGLYTCRSSSMARTVSHGFVVGWSCKRIPHHDSDWSCCCCCCCCKDADQTGR